jgi:hypothetical protein
MTDDVFNLSRRTLFQIGGALLAASVPGFAFAQTTDGKLKIGVIGAGNIGEEFRSTRAYARASLESRGRWWPTTADQYAYCNWC